MARHILQIIPADGWKAAYAIRPGHNKNNPVWVDPLACWALVHEEDVRFTVGLDSTLSFCDQGDNFLGYVSPDEQLDRWREKALQYLKHPDTHRRRV